MRIVAALMLAAAAACSAQTPEGVWRMQPQGAVFAVRAGQAPGVFELVLLDSPDFTLPSDAVMGTMRTTATPWVYDAAISSRPGLPDSPTRNFIVEVEPEEGRLKMKPYRGRRSLSIRRWAGYLFRLSVDYPNRPDDHDGAVRLSPNPGNIVYL